MNHAGAEGGPTNAVSESPVKIVAKPAETDQEATREYYKPYSDLAEHAATTGGLIREEFDAVAVLREGVTFAELTQRLIEARQNAPSGLENVVNAWATTLELSVGIREDAVIGFAQRLKKAHLNI